MAIRPPQSRGACIAAAAAFSLGHAHRVITPPLHISTPTRTATPRRYIRAFRRAHYHYASFIGRADGARFAGHYCADDERCRHGRRRRILAPRGHLDAIIATSLLASAYLFAFYFFAELPGYCAA